MSGYGLISEMPVARFCRLKASNTGEQLKLRAESFDFARYTSRAKRCRVHRIPPRVRDDRDTPLWWGGITGVLEVIWGAWKPKYFCKRDSTQNGPTGKSPHEGESKFH